MQNLYKYKAIRNLFPNKTFVKANNTWKNITTYNKGKITDVDGNHSVNVEMN